VRALLGYGFFNQYLIGVSNTGWSFGLPVLDYKNWNISQKIKLGCKTHGAIDFDPGLPYKAKQAKVNWSPTWNNQQSIIMLTLVSRYVPGQPDLGKGTSASVLLSLKGNRLLWSPCSAGARYRPSIFYNSIAKLVVWSLGCPNSNLVHQVCETQWPTRTGSDRLGHWAVQAHGPSHLCIELYKLNSQLGHWVVQSH
jgi:hypothetical protein